LPGDLEAKVFGGASMFNCTPRKGSDNLMRRVGIENIKAAQDVLRQYGMKVSVEEVGADGGYKIYFESHTGKVLCKLLRSPDRTPLFTGR